MAEACDCRRVWRCDCLPTFIIRTVSVSLAIISATVLLHSRQVLSILYSLVVLLAAIDMPNAVKQRSNTRIAVGILAIGLCTVVAFVYGAGNLQADSDVGCSDADNPVTCRSINAVSGAILIVIGIAESIALGVILLFLPSLRQVLVNIMPCCRSRDGLVEKA